MGKIKITCDSACDLPHALSRHYQIRQFPLSIRMGNQILLDKINVNDRALYNYSQKTGILPVISPVTETDYRKYFSEYIRDGYEVLHISISRHLSDCFKNASAAAEDLPQVSVVDSESFSAGAGQLALLAADLVQADYQLQELTEAMNEMKKHLDVSCVLQSSDFLHRMGKRGGFTALGENFLKLKPELKLKNGNLRRGKTFRGDMEEAILSYVSSCLGERRNIQTDRLFITYSQVPAAILGKVREIVGQIQPFDEILEIPDPCAVSCRCGPGSLGFAFMTL